MILSQYLHNIQTYFAKMNHATLSAIIIIFVLIIFVKYLSIRNQKKAKLKLTPSSKPYTQVITSRDIRAISGDDMMATQLDLARAYIEMGKKQLAKKILDHVNKNGTLTQQQEANQLINAL